MSRARDLLYERARSREGTLFKRRFDRRRQHRCAPVSESMIAKPLLSCPSTRDGATSLAPRTLGILTALFVAAPIVHWLALGPQIPEGTFFLISQLSNITAHDDPSNAVYAFARPPVYALLGWIFVYPLAFLLVGFIAHAIFNGCVFGLAYTACKDLGSITVPNWVLAAVVTLLVFPLGSLFQLTGHGTKLVPHDAYYTFSFRTLAFALIALSYLSLITGRFSTALWGTAASCYTHPTAGFLAFGLFTVAAPIAVQRDQYASILWHWIAAASVAFMPAIWKFLIAEVPPDLQVPMSYGDWYGEMIKDEADDFSVLYQILFLPETVGYYFLLIGSCLIVYSRVFADYHRHISFWFAGAIPALFLVAALAEYVFGVLFTTPIVHPLVTLTVGYRLFSFAFFPLIVMVSRVAMVTAVQAWTALHKHERFRCVLRWMSPTLAGAVIIAGAWAAQLAQGVITGKTAVSLAYAGWALNSGRASGIDTYLSAVARAGDEQLNKPLLFEMSGPAVTYAGERNIFRIHSLDSGQPRRIHDAVSMAFFTTENFEKLIAAIRRNVPVGEGLIIPPYFRYFRDALPNHRIFFQERHDGNLMLGSPQFAGFWKRRMEDLMGFSYEGIPSQYSGLSVTFMRSAFLAIDGSHAAKLKARYPSYRYFVTEEAHVLPYNKVFTTGGFIVYDLDRPRASH